MEIVKTTYITQIESKVEEGKKVIISFNSGQILGNISKAVCMSIFE